MQLRQLKKGNKIRTINSKIKVFKRKSNVLLSNMVVVKYVLHNTETIMLLGTRDLYASACRHYFYAHVNRYALIGCKTREMIKYLHALTLTGG